MKKCVLLAAGMVAAALLAGGCGNAGEKESAAVQMDSREESTAVQMDSREESTAVQMDSAPETVREKQEFSEEDGAEGERMAGPSEGEGSAIAPAATRQEALDLHDKAFAEHDFAYLLASCIEPYGQEYVDFLLATGLLSEEEYWSSYDNSQGMYYEIGVFESYSSEITGEEQIADTGAIEEELLQAYGYSCTVQDAYEVTYNQTASGTEGTAVNEGYRVQMIQGDGSWYISKML